MPLILSEPRAWPGAPAVYGTEVGRLLDADDRRAMPVRHVAGLYLTRPPLPLLRRVLGSRNRVHSLLEGRQRPAQARELYLLAGRLYGLAARMVGDLGWPVEAQTHGRTARLCGDRRTPTLRGWIRATQSKLAYWDGRPKLSAELAEDGLRYAVRDSAGGLLAGLAARGRARTAGLPDRPDRPPARRPRPGAAPAAAPGQAGRFANELDEFRRAAS